MDTDSINYEVVWHDVKRTFGLDGEPLARNECLCEETILVMDFFL